MRDGALQLERHFGVGHGTVQSSPSAGRGAWRWGGGYPKTSVQCAMTPLIQLVTEGGRQIERFGFRGLVLAPAYGGRQVRYAKYWLASRARNSASRAATIDRHANDADSIARQAAPHFGGIYGNARTVRAARTDARITRY